jgi:cytochrome b561
MIRVTPSKYDPVTLWLHGALAIGIVTQLLLSSVMHVPAGPGLGIRDWHREAFEIHAHVGLAVAVVCVLHWLWICSPFSRPGVGCLFPWTQRDKRTLLCQEFNHLLRLKSPSTHRLSPLAGTVHGLGLLAVSGSVAGGIINYCGYFVGAPIPRLVLHWVALSHIVFGYTLWAFVIGHVLMALQHWIANHFHGMGLRRSASLSRQGL